MLSKPHHGLSFLLLSAAAFTVPAQAAVPDADAQQQIEANEERFLQVAGFTPAKDIDDWFDQEWYDEQRFPEANPSSMFQPDANLNPVQKAVMLVDHLEGELPHARYRVRWHTDFPQDISMPWAYIEVARFNLGPAVREDLVEAYGDTLAPLEEFGEGPHVVWRFIMTPVQGQLAQVVSAAHRTLDDYSAQETRCLGQSCLTLDELAVADKEWEDFDNPLMPEFSPRQGQTLSPDQAAGLLALSNIGPEYGEPVEGLSRLEPYLELVVSKNVGGQEQVIQGGSHQSHLMDDSASDVWYRFWQMGDASGWERAFKHRRGGL